jgi:ribosomal protein L2
VITSITASIATAGCAANQDTFMYFDAVRFFKVARVCATNPQQCIAMMIDDVNNGDAVYITRGTSFDVGERVPENPRVTVVKKGNIFLMALTEAVNCR